MSKVIRRWHILNMLIKANGFTRYLELGSTGLLDAPEHNFDIIEVKSKFGVDKKGSPDFRGTTDEFFEKALYSTDFYDLVFIDAKHRKDNVDRDIANSLEILKPGGMIVVHDCNPFDNRATVETLVGGHNGDVWKSIVELRRTRNHLTVNTVDVDWGCAIIHKEWQETPFDDDLNNALDWHYFSKDHERLLGLISYDEFLEMYMVGGNYAKV